MSQHSVSSLARIIVLVLLVLTAIRGGSHGVSSPEDDVAILYPPQTAVATSTDEAIVDLTSTSTATLAPTQVVQQPTSAPTLAPTPEPTQESAPAGRGQFPVPENTTARSIVVERGPADKPFVALSFDAGEGRGYTEEILDILKDKGIHASFGTTGEWARENPDLIERILDEGHLLFNHSESHRSWTGASPGTEPLTPDERTAEVMGAHDSVVDVAEWNMQPFWRPPYGDMDAEGQELLKTLGYDYTFWWTCDSLGWNGYTANEIAEWCGPDTDRGGNGAIILMHVSQEQDYLATASLIDSYSAEGYQFVTLNEMIAD